MTPRPAPIPEDDLHAYVDGLLPPARAAEVEAWLAAHPEKAAEIALWQRQNEALTALFPPIAPENIPDRLKPRQLALRPRGVTLNWTQLAAAAVVVLAIGAGTGWALREYDRPPESDSLIALAVTAHSLYVKENRHAVEVAAADRDHLVSWLSNRVARPITPPDLAPEGFELVGGRLLPGDYDQNDSGPAAQLMYQNAANDRVTVYITAAPPAEKNAYQFTTRENLDAFYWSNDRITCTVVGSLPEVEMKAVAKKIYTQLTWRPDGAPAVKS
jgi:anti-sigma factor RsiW